DLETWRIAPGFYVRPHGGAAGASAFWLSLGRPGPPPFGSPLAGRGLRHPAEPPSSLLRAMEPSAQATLGTTASRRSPAPTRSDRTARRLSSGRSPKQR